MKHKDVRRGDILQVTQLGDCAATVYKHDPRGPMKNIRTGYIDVTTLRNGSVVIVIKEKDDYIKGWYTSMIVGNDLTGQPVVGWVPAGFLKPLPEEAR